MLYQDLIGTILWGIPVNKVPLAKPDKKKDPPGRVDLIEHQLQIQINNLTQSQQQVLFLEFYNLLRIHIFC